MPESSVGDNFKKRVVNKAKNCRHDIKLMRITTMQI